MKPVTLCTIVMSTLAAVNCGMAQAQRSAKPDLIVSSEPFSPSGTFKAPDSRLLGPDSKVEEGEINGVRYRFYYSDGSGFVGGRMARTPDEHGTPAASTALSWDVACKKDAVTDRKMCHMTVPGKNLWVWAYPKGRYIVSIGQDHFPGSTVTVRIDEGKPITAPAKNEGTFSPQESTRLIARLKGASKVTTRYMEWPNQYWVDETWELHAFNEALQYITWAVNRIR